MVDRNRVRYKETKGTYWVNLDAMERSLNSSFLDPTSPAASSVAHHHYSYSAQVFGFLSSREGLMVSFFGRNRPSDIIPIMYFNGRL